MIGVNVSLRGNFTSWEATRLKGYSCFSHTRQHTPDVSRCVLTTVSVNIFRRGNLFHAPSLAVYLRLTSSYVETATYEQLIIKKSPLFCPVA